MYETSEYNLPVQAVVEALDELTPEFRVDVSMHVHTHDDVRSSRLTESMLDAVGNISCQTYLCLHPHIAGTGLLLQAFQQLQSLFTVSG